MHIAKTAWMDAKCQEEDGHSETAVLLLEQPLGL